jgi:L-alanine-DL-glutamate epimerase-like enolase superfamily enzyme
MRIAQVRWRIVNLRTKTLATSYGAGVTERKHVLVRLELEDGHTGFGEASPLPHFTGEFGETIGWIIEHELAPALLGLPVCDLETIQSALDGAVPRHSTAKAALVMAACDAFGKMVGLPVCRLLGGRLVERLAVAGAVGIEAPEETAREARRFVEAGARTIKLKIGRDPTRDVQAMAAVREAVGPAVAIRVDANQGYRPKEAVQVIRALAPYGIQYMEQPVAAPDLDGLTFVRGAVDLPIAVDESLYGPEEALELIKRQAADVFVVKLVKAGGLYRGRQILQLAATARIPCVLVSPYESTLGAAANVHVAASAPNVPWAIEIGINDIPDDPAAGLVYEEGLVRVPEAPGLGVTVADRLFDEGGKG